MSMKRYYQTVSPPPRVLRWCVGLFGSAGLFAGILWNILASTRPDLITHLDKGHLEVMACLIVGLICGAVCGVIIDSVVMCVLTIVSNNAKDES